MLRQTLRGLLLGALITSYFGVAAVRAQEAEVDAKDVEDIKGVEVLTRGPVHEAFAETVTFEPESGLVVEKEPPEPIEETTPDQKPEGSNVVWIPGYWAWDDDRDDFLWITGTWRSLPPGRQWVSGYWTQTGNEYQWISGYWADSQLEQVEYLPEPPALVDQDPTDGSADQTWVPGIWVWQNARYVWRPGYYIDVDPNWVWIPAHYHWSPRGYVFVDGYYDFVVARRGMLFAPVYFNQSVFTQRNFTYSPALAINLNVFSNQLFLRPSYGHYYFGDYYGSAYTTAGFYPWFSTRGRFYDPFYAHQVWQNRRNAGWARSIEANYQRRVDNEDARPPRTFADQRSMLKNGDRSDRKDFAIATPLNRLSDRDGGVKLQKVSKQEQQSLAKNASAIREFQSERRKLESDSDRKGDNRSQKADASSLKLPQSPIAARSSDNDSKDSTPPKRQDAPATDSKVEPKPRSTTTDSQRPNRTRTAKPALPDDDRDAKPGTRKGDSKPEPKTPRRDDRNDDPKSGTDPKPKPGAEPRRDVEPKPRTEPKPMPKDEPRSPRDEQPRTEPKTAPKDEPRAPRGEQPSPRPEPKTAPKDEPRAPRGESPRVEPKPAPKDPKPAPRPEPSPAPRAEPKPSPRPEPNPAPKPEPRPGVRPEPNPAPRNEPKAGSRPEPKATPPGASPRGERKAGQPEGPK